MKFTIELKLKPSSVILFQVSEEVSAEAKYDFNWAVKDDDSNNDFGHQESRDSDYTQGSYYVHLPDGRLQKVTYHVDGDSGFVVDVSYEGEAQYPDSQETRSYAPPAPRPRYSAPEPEEESNESLPPPRTRFFAPKSKKPESEEESREAVSHFAAPESEEVSRESVPHFAVAESEEESRESVPHFRAHESDESSNEFIFHFNAAQDSEEDTAEEPESDESK